jgi:predicted DsbA family dithiol-disulfide isomerase
VGAFALLPPRACETALADIGSVHEKLGGLRSACEELATAVCGELGDDSESCIALRLDMPDIPPGHCPALLRDRDQIIAALRQREAMDAPLSEERWQALIADGAPSLGKKDAKVTLVEFSDFQCPFCAEAARTIKRVAESHGESVRVVFRQYPLPFHKHAVGAAQAALAAHDQGKFWEFHDLLFENQEALTGEALDGYAQSIGLDLKAFRTASSGEATAARVTSDMQLGDSVSVRGTPTVFVNGRRLPNGVEYEAVAAAVDEALAAAK